MKKLFIFLLILLFSGITGCVPSQYDAENIISPPTMTAEQNEIYAALQSSLPSGTVPKLKYPKNGEYRSAFIISNLISNTGTQALAFYEIKGKSAEENSGIRINILNKTGKQWTSVCDIAGEGIEIDKVLFARSRTYNKYFIVIGFALLSGEENLFKVYDYENGQLEQIYFNNYSVLEVCGLYDNYDDNILYLFSKENDEIAENPVKTATARLLRYDGSNFVLAGSAGMYEKVTGYYNVTKGFIEGNKPAVYFDGTDGNAENAFYTTQILTVRDNKLRNEIYNEKHDFIGFTQRDKVPYSMDVDSDGIVEIPQVFLFPNYTEDSEDAVYYTDWIEYNDEQMVKRYSSYADPKERYLFLFPEKWINNVTAKYTAEDNEIIFYELAADNSLGERLFSIRKIKSNQYGELGDDYKKLGASGSFCFCGCIYTTNSDFGITFEQAADLFSLY